MTAKEYLQQIEKLNIQIKHRQEQRAELLTRATRIGANDLSRDRISSNGSNDRIAKYIERYIDMGDEVEERILHLLEVKDQIITQIDGLDKPAYSEILYQRYVLMRKWDDIPEVMHYSITQVYRLHGQALEAFTEKYLSELSEDQCPGTAGNGINQRTDQRTC